MIGLQRAVAFWLAACMCVLAEPRIEWVPAGEGTERVNVEVSGLNEEAVVGLREWPTEKMRALLRVGVKHAGAPPMLGTWKVDARTLRFSPQFPLTAGVAYRAEFDGSLLPGGKAGRVTSDFTMPAPRVGPGTLLTHIHPSAEEVPENLLKFYLHFSAPMSRGNIYDHIHLRDEKGKDVELPFLEIDEELWDPEMKRLTLFIDPGRIKREVRPLEEVGPSLQVGHRFTLAIDPAWLDATGRPLARKHERTFHVGPPDRTPITPAEWEITAPAAGSKTALRVNFRESMDHALALRLLRVRRANGKDVAGVAALSDAERNWSFIPSESWLPGTYDLVVPAILEDLAGNNVGKAFEVELLERGERVEHSRPAYVPFTVK